MTAGSAASGDAGRPEPPFRVAAASLSGESDAAWARSASPYVGAAFLGGIALDEPTRAAAREMVARDRTEFLPDEPVSFVDDQLARLSDAPLVPGFNVRAVAPGPVRRAAAVCRSHGAILEVNAHCRQDEMCDAGTGETLLRDPDRLRRQVGAAAATMATVSVKVRAEVPGVDLPAVAVRAVDAGADLVHVDAMDTESVVADVAAAIDDEATRDAAVVANNGVRDEATVREYFDYGADAVSVGRPSDDTAVLRRVGAAVEAWFGDRRVPVGDGDSDGDGLVDAGQDGSVDGSEPGGRGR